MTFRLPTFAEPERYELFLHPNLTTQTYTGHIIIHISVVQSTEYLVFHSTGHDVHDISLINEENEQSQSTSLQLSRCVANEQVAVTFPDKETQFKAGTLYKLNVSFSGSLDPHGLYGFYLSSYVDSNNVTASLASTQFESVYARKAFPCYDEPNFKVNVLL